MNNILYKDIEQKDDIFHKEIVETFFGKPKKAAPPKKALPPKKKSRLPLVLSFIALVIIGFSSLYILIANPPKAKDITQTINRSYKRLLFNGVFDRDIIQSFSFEGDAKAESELLRNSIKFVNKESQGWARATFKLNSYENFLNSNLLISGKSLSGRKSIILILKDTNNNAYQIEDIEFSPKWETKFIKLNNKEGFDIERVNSISIEYGTKTAGNTNGSIIYIKEIGLRKGGNKE